MSPSVLMDEKTLPEVVKDCRRFDLIPSPYRCGRPIHRKTQHIKVSPNAGKVTASYTVDEQVLGLTVKMLAKRLVVAHKCRRPAVTWPIHSTDRP